MLMGVFPYLTAKEMSQKLLTCTRWFALLTDTSLWEKTDLSARTIQHLPRTSFDNVLSSILKRYGNPMMHRLMLCGRRDVTVESLSLIGGLARNLNELHLCFIKDTTDDVVLNVARNCRVLEKISLRGCSSLTDASISYLFRERTGLKWVMLQGLSQLTDSALEKMPPQLNNLCLNGCKRLTDRALERLSEQCPKLAKLNLNNVGFSDIGIAALVRGCPLISLHLGSDARLPQTQTSAENGARIIHTDLSLESLAAHSQDLEELNLRGAKLITNDGVRILIENTPKLRLLHLGGCSRITDLVFPRTTPSMSMLFDNVVLDHVDLSFTSITDATIHALSLLPRVRILGLQGCALLTTECLSAFCDPGFPLLRHLNVSMCDAELCRSIRDVLAMRSRKCVVKGFVFGGR